MSIKSATGAILLWVVVFSLFVFHTGNYPVFEGLILATILAIFGLAIIVFILLAFLTRDLFINRKSIIEIFLISSAYIAAFFAGGAYVRPLFFRSTFVIACGTFLSIPMALLQIELCALMRKYRRPKDDDQY